MDPLEITQAALGTASLLSLARSGWLFFKAIEPGWQQDHAWQIGGTVPMLADELKARDALCYLVLGVVLGIIGMWVNLLVG